APPGERDTDVRAELIGPGREVREVAAHATLEPRATRAVGSSQQNYDSCGVAVAIPLDELAEDLSAPGQTTVWRIRLTVRIDGIERSGSFLTARDDALPSGWFDVTESLCACVQ